MDALEFTIITLAVWRITHLLQAEDGPWDLVYKLKKIFGNSFFGSLMDCFYCLSIWIALPFGIVFGNTPLNTFLFWMALSGAACLLEQATTKNNAYDKNKTEFFEENNGCKTLNITN